MKTRFSHRKICIALLVMFGISFQAFAQAPNFEVKDIAAQKALIIKVSILASTINQALGETYGKLFGYLKQIGMQPAGPPFAVYYSFDPKGNAEFEAAVPVNSTIQGTDELKFKVYPAMKVISSLFIGPNDKMAPLYVLINKYATDNKIEILTPSWEVYLDDPGRAGYSAKFQRLVYLVIK